MKIIRLKQNHKQTGITKNANECQKHQVYRTPLGAYHDRQRVESTCHTAPKQIIDKQLQDKPNKANPSNQPLDFGRVFSDQIKPRPKDHGINQK